MAASLKEALERAIGRLLASRVRKYIRSRTLRRALTIKKLDEGGHALTIPHYWAIYYHDGRGPVRPVNGKYLVYFSRIEDDPRVRGGRDYPVRKADIRPLRLAPGEFRRLVREGKLIVRRSVGPAAGEKFFDKALAAKAARLAAPLVRTEVRRRIQEELRAVLRLRGNWRIQ